MTGELVLVVDDDEDILELVSFNLVRQGYRFETAGNGEEAVNKARSLTPDLIILDLMLPGLDGIEVCRVLKRDRALREVPILMLTARGEESDVVAGLEAGADDYVIKPFSPRVLAARARALLRRAGKPERGPDAPVRVHGILLDPARHEARLSGEPLALTASEFRLLHLLARSPGRVFTRDQIIDGVHGLDYAVTSRSVDVLLNGLRKKLGESAGLIETVRGIGYRMKE